MVPNSKNKYHKVTKIIMINKDEVKFINIKKRFANIVMNDQTNFRTIFILI